MSYHWRLAEHLETMMVDGVADLLWKMPWHLQEHDFAVISKNLKP